LPGLRKASDPMSRLTLDYAIREAVDALCEYGNEGGTGFDALEALEAAEEYARAAWVEAQS
jgi:hypothetical protein